MKLIQVAFRKICGKLEYELGRSRLNLFATLYVNFRTLPFNIAKKLPIYVYGRFGTDCLRGGVKISYNIITRGMIKLGRHKDRYVQTTGKSYMKIGEGAQIEFLGKCSVGRQFVFRVDSGHLRIGHLVWIGENVRIDCNEYIEVGNNTSISHSCFLSDSNHHYVINSNNQVYRMKGRVIIGESNWIGNNCIITKGTVTSDGSILSHNTWAHKDYIKEYDNTDSMLLVGNPAKAIGFGIRRIFSNPNQNLINNYFNKNSNEDVMQLDYFINDSHEEIYF